MQNETAALERPKDAGPGPRGVVARWLMEIKLASKEEKSWRENARKTVDRYRDEESTQKNRTATNFNILYANTEVQRPSLYSNTPRADIRRRRQQDESPESVAQDQMARAVAEGMERAATYMIDEVDFDYVMRQAVQDYLLPGRAVTRLRYVPTIKEEEVIDEKVELEPWGWDRFRRGPGANWNQLPWIAFELILDRTELVDQFGKAGEKVELNVTRESVGDEVKRDDEKTIFSRGRVWEIWDKRTRKVIYIAPSVEDGPLKEMDDPLKLKRFWPMPRPLYYVWTTDTLIPIEADRQYRAQADELNQVTNRIRRLNSALKVRGIYDATMTEMSRVLEGGDNELIPSTGAQNILAQTGTLERHIWFLPIEQIAKVLAQLYVQREQIKQTIYEITGLSDILRGSTDANETLGAQKLKAQTGSLRLQERQREVQRYARDLVEMIIEVMAEHFQQDTLSLIVGEQISDEVMQVLRSQGLRDVSVNIETDSTISVDQSQDQEAVTRLLDGVTSYMAAVAPAVESGVMTMDAAKAILVSAVRRFRLGREVEEQLEDTGQQQQPQVSPEQIQQIQEQAMQQAEQAVQQERMQVEADKAKLEQAKGTLGAQQKEMQNAAQLQSKSLQVEKREALADIQKAALQLEERGMKLDGLNTKVDEAIQLVEEKDGDNQNKADELHSMDSQIRELSQAVATMAQTVAESSQAQLEANAQVLEVLSADKELVFDKGRPVGTRLKVVK